MQFYWLLQRVRSPSNFVLPERKTRRKRIGIGAQPRFWQNQRHTHAQGRHCACRAHTDCDTSGHCVYFVLLCCVEPLSIPSDQLSAAVHQIEDGGYNSGYYCSQVCTFASFSTKECLQAPNALWEHNQQTPTYVCAFLSSIVALRAGALSLTSSIKANLWSALAHRLFPVVPTQLTESLLPHSWPQNDAYS